MQGALGSAQMDRAAEIIEERRRLAKVFNEAFAQLDWLRTPVEPEGYQHGYQSYPCLFQPQEVQADTVKEVNQARNEWMDALQQQGISTRPATHAVHLLSFYRDKYELKPEDFPNAYAADQCSISLPLFHGMSEEEQAFVIETVTQRRS
jgi:perosamine synthetase